MWVKCDHIDTVGLVCTTGNPFFKMLYQCSRGVVTKAVDDSTVHDMSGCGSVAVQVFAVDVLLLEAAVTVLVNVLCDC